MTVNGQRNIKIGDCIIFGNYKGNTEWIVLDIKGENALIFSKYTVEECMYFNPLPLLGGDGYTTTTWEASYPRKWLNTEYFSEAFSEEEKTSIVDVHNINDSICKEGGNDTYDKVFLLTKCEIEKYLPNKESRIGMTKEGDKVHWFTRTLGVNNINALGVINDGSFNTVIFPGGWGTIRPALLMKI